MGSPLPLKPSEMYVAYWNDRQQEYYHYTEIIAKVYSQTDLTYYIEEVDNVSDAPTIRYSNAVLPTTLATSPEIELTKRYYRWRLLNGTTSQTLFPDVTINLVEPKTAICCDGGGSIPGTGGDMYKAVYDKDGNLIVDNADAQDRTYTANENIAEFKVVRLDTADAVKLADFTDPDYTHAEAVIGFSTESKLLGEQITVRFEGQIVNPAWTLIPGDPVFLSTSGDITQIAPTTNVLLQVGLAEDTQTVLVNVEDVIILS